MEFRVHDTRTGDLHALPEGRPITLYVCGITPYDTTHLGHGFTYVHADTLVRALRWIGREVTYIQNVTDIDDSILARSRTLGIDWQHLGELGMTRYAADMRALNVADPTRLVPATSVMPVIVSLVERLVDRDAAYVVPGGTVYFRVRTRDYGALSRLDRGAMLEIAARQDDADVDDPRKEDPLDSALWKGWSGDPGEPRWGSPWGEGRPGWHVECAAINLAHLGPRVDIHGGGADLVFPHHETEIALMETATGQRPFAGTWFHTAMVREGGEKMSKSLGNMAFVTDLVERFGGDAVRLYLLVHHYRAVLDHGDDAVAEAAERWAGLRAMAARGARRGSSGDDEARDAFAAALADDLDVPRALGVLEGCRGPIVTELAAVLGLRLPAG